jgi:hypothetical protein
VARLAYCWSPDAPNSAEGRHYWDIDDPDADRHHKVRHADEGRPFKVTPTSKVVGEAQVAQSAGTERPTLTNVATMPKPDESDDWVVEDIARPSAIVVVASPEGLGKSYIRKETELRLGSGKGPLFGRFAIDRPFVVATFEEENGPEEEWRRDEQVLAALDITRKHLGDRVHRVSYPGLDLTHADPQEYVRGEVEAVGADVVWLDTGGSMVGEEWGEPMKQVFRFLRSLDVTVFLNVHLVKPARGQARGGASHGSTLTDVMGQWTRQADAVLVMSDLGEGRARVLVRKRVPKRDLVMAQQNGLWVVVDEGTGAGSDPKQEDRVLRAVNAGATDAEAVRRALDMPVRTVYRHVGSLRKAGFLDTKRGPYRLTEAGEEAVEALL